VFYTIKADAIIYVKFTELILKGVRKMLDKIMVKVFEVIGFGLIAIISVVVVDVMVIL
jgi:hypothetical protein